MALEFPYTGEALLNEVNDLSEHVDGIHNNITTTLENAYDDNFHIADLVTTTRDNLGEDYLLCNGDVLYEWDEHSDIIPYVDKVASKWYYECPKKGVLFTSHSAFFNLVVEQNYDSNTNEKISDVILLKRFDTLQDFIEGKSSLSSNVYTCKNKETATQISFWSHVSFKENFYLSLYDKTENKTKVLVCHPNVNPVLWKEVTSEVGNINHHLISNEKMICWITTTFNHNQIGDCWYEILYKTSIDGEIFSDLIVCGRNYHREEDFYLGNVYTSEYCNNNFSLGLNGMYVTILSGYDGGYTDYLCRKYYGEIDYSTTFPTISFSRCNLSPDLELRNICISQNGEYGYGTVNYSGYFETFYLSKNAYVRSKVYRNISPAYVGDIHKRNGIYYVLSGATVKIILGETVFSDSPDIIYDNEQNKIRKEAKFANGLGDLNLHFEDRDFYIYDTEETFQIVPKKDGVISSLPTISLGGLNTYIKVKE